MRWPSIMKVFVKPKPKSVKTKEHQTFGKMSTKKSKEQTCLRERETGASHQPHVQHHLQKRKAQALLKRGRTPLMVPTSISMIFTATIAIMAGVEVGYTHIMSVQSWAWMLTGWGIVQIVAAAMLVGFSGHGIRDDRDVNIYDKEFYSIFIVYATFSAVGGIWLPIQAWRIWWRFSNDLLTNFDKTTGYEVNADFVWVYAGWFAVMSLFIAYFWLMGYVYSRVMHTWFHPIPGPAVIASEKVTNEPSATETEEAAEDWEQSGTN